MVFVVVVCENIVMVAEIATLSGSKQLYNPQNMLNMKRLWLHEAVIERVLSVQSVVRTFCLCKAKFCGKLKETTKEMADISGISTKEKRTESEENNQNNKM